MLVSVCFHVFIGCWAKKFACCWSSPAPHCLSCACSSFSCQTSGRKLTDDYVSKKCLNVVADVGFPVAFLWFITFVDPVTQSVRLHIPVPAQPHLHRVGELIWFWFCESVKWLPTRGVIKSLHLSGTVQWRLILKCQLCSRNSTTLTFCSLCFSAESCFHEPRSLSDLFQKALKDRHTITFTVLAPFYFRSPPP